jgi:hypothetical protein
MNDRSGTLLLALALAGSAGLSGCGRADAGEKKPYGFGSGPVASASASASASALAPDEIAPPPSSARGKWDPDLSAPPLPSDPSKPPALGDWASAPEAPEVRLTEPKCRVQRIREWYRISCKFEHAIERVTGSIEDVKIDCHTESPDEPFCDEAYVIFPARRGDRRVFEVFDMSRWGPQANAVISEQYLEGDKLPLITVEGLRWGF